MGGEVAGCCSLAALPSLKHRGVADPRDHGPMAAARARLSVAAGGFGPIRAYLTVYQSLDACPEREPPGTRSWSLAPSGAAQNTALCQDASSRRGTSTRSW